MARLNRVELLLMNNGVRAASQRFLELPAFESMLRVARVDLRGARILDAGCGSGGSTALLSDRLRPQRLVGVDLMPEQIERAVARGVPADLRVGDIGQLGEPDGAFDAVFVFGILHHIGTWRQVLHELARVLAPGGVLLVEEIQGRAVRWIDRIVRTSHPPDAAFTWPELRSGLSTAGFSILAERALALGAARSFLCRRSDARE